MKTLNPNNRNPRNGLSYEEVAKVLIDAGDGVASLLVEVGVGNNRVARFINMGDGTHKIEIRYYGTLIAYLFPDDTAVLWVNKNDWGTNSTKTTLDWCILPLGYRMTKVGKTWKVYEFATGSYRDYYPGMLVIKKP